ncbi:MAG: GDP-mannose 4,6-dehydratase [Candidatus Omnitrophica bacterium]|nr:GDP-mannose 4,6-dehydratase [Candidatus Omnitrophota bacterium]
MKVLITGITGFVGSHLAEYLLTKKNVEVYGIERWRSKEDNILNIKEKIRLSYCDLRDASSVHEIIRKIKPERIFHLAAQSFVLSSWMAPAETLTTNIIGELNLFEAVRELGLHPRIHIAGSSEEYGSVLEKELPVKETNPLRPLSPYGVSKVGQDLLAYQYHQSYGLYVVRTRAFNHTGPRRGEVFATSNFAKQIALIEKRRQEPVVKVGNLTSRRDFTDVRDVVKAYWLALEKGEKGEVYNICSGKDYTMRQVLNLLLQMAKVKPKIKQDPRRMRPSDVMRLLGDNTKFRKLTGWKPEIPFRKTLKDLLNYWRERV